MSNISACLKNELCKRHVFVMLLVFFFFFFLLSALFTLRIINREQCHERTDKQAMQAVKPKPISSVGAETYTLPTTYFKCCLLSLLTRIWNSTRFLLLIHILFTTAIVPSNVFSSVLKQTWITLDASCLAWFFLSSSPRRFDRPINQSP